jgi:hypothetical protein
MKRRNPKEKILSCILTYETVGATSSELSDEVVALNLRDVEIILKKLFREGLIIKNGRKRHFGKRGGASPDIWVGSDFFVSILFFLNCFSVVAGS